LLMPAGILIRGAPRRRVARVGTRNDRPRRTVPVHRQRLIRAIGWPGIDPDRPDVVGGGARHTPEDVFETGPEDDIGTRDPRPRRPVPVEGQRDPVQTSAGDWVG